MGAPGFGAGQNRLDVVKEHLKGAIGSMEGAFNAAFSSLASFSGADAAPPPPHLDSARLGPPPPPHGPVPPGLGDGPPPAPEERAAIEDTRQEEEATRPTATPTTSAIPEPRQDSRDDLKSKVADLQRAVERHDELVRDYRTYCDELESKNQECFITISELTNEAKELRKEVDKHSRQLPLVCEDVVALKQQAASLEQALAWLTPKTSKLDASGRWEAR